MTNHKLTTLGFCAAGAGIGAALALLYAPKAGKHTRRGTDNVRSTLEVVGERSEEGLDRLDEYVRSAAK